MSPAIASLDDLLRLADLANIVLYEVSGKRRDGFDLSDVPEDSGLIGIKVLWTTDPGQIRVRCQLSVSTQDGLYWVDAAAVFHLTEPVEAPPDLLESFADAVGVPAVYPYLRTELHMQARRLGLKPPILKLLKPGELLDEDRPRDAEGERRAAD